MYNCTFLFNNYIQQQEQPWKQFFYLGLTLDFPHLNVELTFTKKSPSMYTYI